MRPKISLTKKVSHVILLSMTLLFVVVNATPQGRGRRVGGIPPVVHVPGVRGGGVGARQSCVQACNTFHRNEMRICRGRRGRDRASCQQSINEQHRRCMQSCPR